MMNGDEGKDRGGAKGPKSSGAAAARRARMARALRANLGRRKAQARQRRNPLDLGDASPPSKPPGAN